MYILVVNCGSSSLKLKLVETSNHFTTVFEARAEHLDSTTSTITVKVESIKEILPTDGIMNHESALKEIIEYLVSNSIISSLADISCVGHRVVHGGAFFSKPVIIDNYVIEKIDECSILAPLHNPASITGIRICQSVFSDATQIAIFDTAFHRTNPKKNQICPIPKDLSIKNSGFHGTSHFFLSKSLSKLVGGPENVCAITCHIGQGTSISAIKHCQSLSNSMGVSPGGGCVMITRSGNIDPAIISLICKIKKCSVEEACAMLTTKSGMYGICGRNSMLDVLDGVEKGDQDCIDAYDVFCDSVAKNISNCVIDLEESPKQIVFSGGIGENSDVVREEILKRVSPVLKNIYLDNEANKANSTKISTSDSSVDIYVIPTDEELEIATQAYELLTQS